MIEITVTLDEIGYGEILEKLAQSDAAKENTELGHVLSGVLRYGRRTVDVLPESVKESLAVRALEQYKDQLCAGAEKLMEQNGVPARIESLTVRRTEGR